MKSYDKLATYRFGEFAARLHDLEAERNNFGRQQEVDHLLLIGLTE